MNIIPGSDKCYENKQVVFNQEVTFNRRSERSLGGSSGELPGKKNSKVPRS